MSRIIKVGMLGIGNVGRGTYQALEMNRELIAEKTGLDAQIYTVSAGDGAREITEEVGL